jgi:DNA (cytosine-5)-methyltransferase 3A
MKKINVLSLFDGMSCGQQALDRLGIQVENYYASEIDKYAIQITQKNYPNTIQIGSVIDVKASQLPKIDLLIGGSPCQNLSFAGKMNGLSTKENIEIYTLEHYLELKEQGFQFDGQSYLFWEYMRLLKEVQPKYFLLENVVMSKKWKDIFSQAIGCQPVLINSSLVSAQTRKRLYWTNIPNISQPSDKGLYLRDILGHSVDEKYYLSDMVTERFQMVDSQSYVGTTAPDFRTIGQRDLVYGEDNKMGCLVATDYKQPKQILISQVDRLIERMDIDMSIVTKPTILDVYNKKLVEGDKCNTLTLPHHNAQRLIEPKREIIQLNQAKESNSGRQPFQQNRVYDIDGVTPALMAHKSDLNINTKPRIRKLTPIECERLQTVKDNYTEGVSDTQRYKMLGNGWTVDVIAHIFSFANLNEL